MVKDKKEAVIQHLARLAGHGSVPAQATRSSLGLDGILTQLPSSSMGIGPQAGLLFRAARLWAHWTASEGLPSLDVILVFCKYVPHEPFYHLPG